MSEHEFEITVRTEGERQVVLDMAGDVNAAAQARLEEAHQSIDSSGFDSLILDFEDVEFINSTGIALIVGMLARARAANLDVFAYGLTDHYRQIFQITRLSDFMGIYEDRLAALRAAKV